MKVKIKKGTASGKITAPPSKSYAHRILIAAFLSQNSCKIENVAFSRDILETLGCLESLGANYKKSENSVEFFKEQKAKTPIFTCNESGSTLRFLIPISLVFFDSVEFICGERLIKRGIGVYEEIFKDYGISFNKTQTKIQINGKLKSGKYKIKGDISSQFISGLMFSLPLLKEDSFIEIIEPFESKSYVDITVEVLKNFGINIEKQGENLYFIKGGQKYISKNSFVENDWSNSAFFYALNYIGGNVLVEGLNQNSKQGDKECLNIFENLKKGNLDINLSLTPDLAPIVFCLSAILNGGNFTGTKRLAIKESDRRESVKQELEKLGIKVEIDGDFVKVIKGDLQIPNEPINSHNDHRIAMAFAVLLTLTGGEIMGAECTLKSYPNFFSELEKLNIGVEYEY